MKGVVMMRSFCTRYSGALRTSKDALASMSSLASRGLSAVTPLLASAVSISRQVGSESWLPDKCRFRKSTTPGTSCAMGSKVS